MLKQSFQLFFNRSKEKIVNCVENLLKKLNMLTKTKIKEVIENFPEEISIDEF